MEFSHLPQFTLPDIHIGVGEDEFTKGLALYDKGAIGTITADYNGWQATVYGTHPYHVSVAAKSFDIGQCDCYIGLRDELCKHMIALAIALVHIYRPNDSTDITIPLDQAVCSSEVRDLTPAELKNTKADITKALTYIKNYNGPSSRWFQYQHSLIQGSRLTLLALANLPVCPKSVLICISTLKRLDKKVLGAVDDSDGTVGNLMCQIVELLNLFADSDPNLTPFIKKNLPKGEAFDWEAGFGVLG